MRADVGRARASSPAIFAWHTAARKALKSCVPTSAAGAVAHRARRRAADGTSRRARRARPGAPGDSRAGRCSGARVAAKRAWNASATGVAQSTATRARQVRVDAAHPRGLRARGGGVEVHDLHASRGRRRRCGPAAIAPTRSSAIAAQRALERVLHAAAVRLRLPAGERRARRTRGRARCAWSRAARGAAPSPARGDFARDQPSLPMSACASAFCRVVAFAQHFLQDLARALDVAHFLVGLGEVELGRGVVPLPVEHGRRRILAPRRRARTTGRACRGRSPAPAAPSARRIAGLRGRRRRRGRVELEVEVRSGARGLDLRRSTPLPPAPAAPAAAATRGDGRAGRRIAAAGRRSGRADAASAPAPVAGSRAGIANAARRRGPRRAGRRTMLSMAAPARRERRQPTCRRRRARSRGVAAAAAPAAPRRTSDWSDRAGGPARRPSARFRPGPCDIEYSSAATVSNADGLLCCAWISSSLRWISCRCGSLRSACFRISSACASRP